MVPYHIQYFGCITCGNIHADSVERHGSRTRIEMVRARGVVTISLLTGATMVTGLRSEPRDLEGHFVYGNLAEVRHASDRTQVDWPEEGMWKCCAVVFGISSSGSP